LRKIISNFYSGKKQVSFFDYSGVDENGKSETIFLVDRKFVVNYSIGYDRNILVGAINLGIGPKFFTPADFWSYQNFERFRMTVDVESIEINLRLLDEFFSTGSLQKS
jgi:hypothetical protein